MKKRRIETDIEIVDIGAKGAVIGKKEGITYLCQGPAVPGDIATLEIRRKKKGMPFGRVKEITKASEMRVEPKCSHFEHCGGCNWQNLNYADQIKFKEKQVHEQMRRIAGVTGFEARPILGSSQIYEYRNKMEFTFVSNRWLTPEEIASKEEIPSREGVGFHVPGRFDWVLHVEQCHLQDSFHNEMRNYFFNEAKRLSIPFYHPRDKKGNLRNVLFRNTMDGHWMVLLVVSDQNEDINTLCGSFLSEFPDTYSFWVITNTKVNDSFTDCPATLIYGKPELTETFTRKDDSTAQFLIGPKSFFQTNPKQAEHLYHIVYEFANLTGDELVYDLYTGTGSIALFLADKAKEVIGVEYVPEAIEDAKRNAELNDSSNTTFYAGDMKEVLDEAFVEKHGVPDVLITDPPRAGMHEEVVQTILNTAPKRIVYVSCDPATQARDIKLLSEAYQLVRIQPVDMFPHTSHVENVALLELRTDR